jgi:hypothetical protein
MRMPNDSGMLPGQTYTFTFELQNWVLSPDVSQIISDLDQYAPQFISYPSAAYGAKPGFFQGAYMTVTFQYSGDGSDIIGDVSNSMIAAFSSGSNDTFSFVQADSDAISSVGPASGTPGGLDLSGIEDALKKAKDNFVPSETTIIAIVVGLIVVAFIMSGGPAVARSATT